MNLHWPKFVMNLKELEQKRDKEVTGFFWLGLQIAFIFGIPAFLAVWIGGILNQQSDTNFRAIFLVLAFVISWVIVILIYQRKTKKLKELDLKIKEMKQKSLENNEHI